MQTNIMKGGFRPSISRVISQRFKILSLYFGREGLPGIFHLALQYYDIKFRPLKLLGKPLTVQLELTTFCNSRCSMCRQSIEKIPPKHMSIGHFKKILGRLGFIYKLRLVGMGETLMNPDLFEIIRYAKAKGKEVEITTNGSLLTTETIQKFEELDIDLLEVSVDTFDKSNYEKIRRGLNFDRVIGNLKIACTSRLKVRLDMLNFDNFENEIRNMKKLGLDPSSFSEIIIAEENKIMTLKRSKQEGRCNRLWEIPYINVDGNLALCCFKPLTSDLNLGSLYNNSFETLWNSRKMMDLRRDVKRKKCPCCVGCMYLG